MTNHPPAGHAGSRYPFLTQKERDLETGLDYFLARYYSSPQGRFISSDEFTGGPHDLSYFTNTPVNPTFYAELAAPQSLNKYQYCYNSPLRFVDPDGHQAEQIAQRILGSPTGQQIINAAGAAITVTIVAASGVVQKLADSASKYDTTCPECSWERNPITEKFNPSFYRNNSQNNSGNQTQQGASQSNQSSAANPNPNDPDKKPVFGERGTQTTSTTVGKGQGYRIDVENPNPGQRPGQIHYQSGDKKYLYDPNTKSFVGASKSENKRIINDPIVQRAIDKRLNCLVKINEHEPAHEK